MEAERRATYKYSYDERNAIIVIRAAMLKKPHIIEEIMRDASREMAVRVLKKAHEELGQLLEVNRAFIAASTALVKQEKES